MKLQSTEGKGVETNNNSSESLEFGIGNASVVIEILRNRLYSNPIQTLVQEYICNARDAHREAGKDSEQIEVGLPSTSNPLFYVRDYGCGISPERIKDIFVNYGSSTKRDTDSQTGGFGIGAKSAWAYTDNFTIKAVYDGVERHYLAHIGTKNNGVLEKILERGTEKPNQTTIEIAVKQKDCDAFISSSLRATMFWSVRPRFFCIGQEFKEWVQSSGNGAYIGPEWYSSLSPEETVFGIEFYTEERLNSFFRKASYWDTGAVMIVDGVPYYLESTFKPQYNDIAQVLDTDGRVICFRVGNGDCEVSASREKIADSEISKKSLSSIFSGYLKKIKEDNKTRLSSVKSLSEFKNLCGELLKTYNSTYCGSFSYSGWSLKGNRIYSSDQSKNLLKFYECKNYVQRSKNSPTGKKTVLSSSEFPISCGLPANSEHFFYLDREYSKLELRDRVRQILPESLDTDSRVIVFLENNSLSAEFFAKPLSSINLNKKKRAVSNKETKKIALSVYNHEYRYYRAKNVNFKSLKVSMNESTGTKYVYSIKQDDNFPNYYEMAADLHKYGISFCLIDKKYEEKIKKNPEFISFSDFVTDFRTHVTDSAFYNKLYKEKVSKQIHGMDDFVVNYLFTRDFSSIDQKLEKMVLSLGKKVIKDEYSQSSFGWVEKFDIEASIPNLKTLNENGTKLVEYLKSRYSLIFCISTRYSTQSGISKELDSYFSSKSKS